MRILGIDTATLTASIALLDDDRVIADAIHDTRDRRSADLLVSIDALCTRAAITPLELDAIAIGAGPGSFTGLRIGMATAKGIAFAAGKPLWAVSSLAALAHDARIARRADIVAVLDARRGEVFAGCYREGTLVGEERVLAPADLVPWITTLGIEDAAFAGDALAAHPVLAALADRWLPVSTPTGTAVAQLARAGARIDIVTSGAPTYIRASEAEIMYPDGVPGALRRR